MTDYIGIAPDGPGRCEYPDCTEPGTDNGYCEVHAVIRTTVVNTNHLIRTSVLAALREQALESLHVADSPGYNRAQCLDNSHWFEIVADWLDDNWTDIFTEERA